MAEITSMIMREIEQDGSIAARGIKLEVVSKGLFRRRKTLRLFGSVGSEREKVKAARIAQHHAGDQYDLVNDLEVKEPAGTR